MPLWHCGLPFAGVPHSLLSRSAQHTAPFNKLLHSEETVRLWSQKSSLRVKGKRNPSLPSSQIGEDLGPSSNKRQSRFPISSFLIPTPHRWRGHCYEAPKDKGRNCVCDQLCYVHGWGGGSGVLAQMLTSLGNPDLLSPPSRAKFSSTNQGKLQCHACPPSLIRPSAKGHAVS